MYAQSAIVNSIYEHNLSSNIQNELFTIISPKVLGKGVKILFFVHFKNYHLHLPFLLFFTCLHLICQENMHFIDDTANKLTNNLKRKVCWVTTSMVPKDQVLSDESNLLLWQNDSLRYRGDMIDVIYFDFIKVIETLIRV